jgi:LuxR family transcriptional regulator, maltose regulon positive regulatory protein
MPYNQPMPESILATKLYVPSPQPQVVSRPRLLARLDEGLHRKLTIVSAPAGFGKTTLVGQWVASCARPVAWVSLDAGDSDPTRFLTYLVAALQTIAEHVGQQLLGVLQSPQPPPIAATLTALLNDIATVPDPFIVVLDDYHALDASAVDNTLAFLLDHLPPRMHLVITTREDPHLPLARLRARGQLTELRASDLQFTFSEATEFLNQAVGLALSTDDIAALETRTEGWIAGLQLAAISMRERDDASSFITSFTGSHRFVLDYLVEEVLHQQPERVQEFLLRTSVLERLCGPLCDAVLLTPATTGQDTLEYLERANLFIVPLDDERRWYRYHHLFAELLRQRLHESAADDVTDLHARASVWFEEQGLEFEALHHAAAANDLERAERLIEARGMPLYVRGGAVPVLNWLESLPETALDARPSLLVMFASVLSVVGRLTRVEAKLVAAETAIRALAPDDELDQPRELVGRIADMRAMMALMTGDMSQMETIIAQSRRALEYLPTTSLRLRAATIWRLGLAHQRLGHRAPARSAFAESMVASEMSGYLHMNIMATTCLGWMEEFDLQLHQATETFRRVLQLVGDPPWGVACEAYVGLARIAYEWNDLDTAWQHGQQSVRLAHQVDASSFVSSEVFLARLQLAQGDVTGAIAALAETERVVRQKGFVFRLPEIATAQVRASLHAGHLEEAERLARDHNLLASQARVHLAQGDPSAALAVLEQWRQQVEAKEWEDERLRAMLLQALAHHALGDLEAALVPLADALALAEPSGFIRLFLDEGAPMNELLSVALARGIRPDYTGKLQAAFDAERPASDYATEAPPIPNTQPLIEPLSQRELEVLRLIAAGLSNREICDRLYLALNTVKGHNRVIFSKLQVERRTEAVARARELNLI